MSCFVIMLGGRRRFLAHAKTPAPPSSGRLNGWKPFVWVSDLTDAEKFGSKPAAVLFAHSALPHSLYDIVEIKTAPGPGQGVVA